MNELTITAILLGSALSVIFILFVVLPYKKLNKKVVTSGKETNPLVRQAAGAFVLVFGLIMLLAWIYFLVEGREALVSHISAMILHIVLMLLSSLSLIIAGLAMLRRWHHSAGAFFGSLGLTSFSIIVSLLQYGNMGHPFLMNGIALVVLIVLVYFVGLIYAFEHFVFHLDEKDESDL